MGFLTVNTTERAKRSGSIHKGKRKRLRGSRSASPQDSTNAPDTPIRSTASLHTLPQEILEKIFVLSGNLEFPQTTLTLARKLSRTRSLERRMLAGQQTEDKGMPVSVVKWHFVTAELLKESGVEYFVDAKGSTKPMLPFSFEKKVLTLFDKVLILNNQTGEDFVDPLIFLAAYMVRRGCQVENSSMFCYAFIKMNFIESVLALGQNKQRLAAVDVAIIQRLSGLWHAGAI